LRISSRACRSRADAFNPRLPSHSMIFIASSGPGIATAALKTSSPRNSSAVPGAVVACIAFAARITGTAHSPALTPVMNCARFVALRWTRLATPTTPAAATVTRFPDAIPRPTRAVAAVPSATRPHRTLPCFQANQTATSTPAPAAASAATATPKPGRLPAGTTGCAIV
jgi:hypothetical protein